MGDDECNGHAYGEYMVFVSNRDRPVKVHDDFASASAEADRLCLLPANVGREIYVLEIRKKIRGKIFIEDL